MARHGNRGASRKRNGTETRIGTEPIYGDMIAVIYSTPDGRLRVAVEEMGVERQSWPIERSAHAVQELAARIRGIRETLIAKHGPDLGPRNPLLFREGEVVEAPSSHGELARREAMLPTYAPRRRRKVLSYGGGIDSFAMLVDAVQRGEKPDLVVFADVTDRNREDPGEWPETYSHIERVAIPYCNQHGIPFVWLHTDQSPVRGHRSLYAYLRSLNAMVGRTSRMCTVAAKVERVAAFLAAEFPRETVEVWIGFEAGEEDRADKDPHAVGSSAKRASKASLRVSRFPMIERRICRCRAVELIRAAGLEVPPGSACVYCPFSSRGDFQRLDEKHPTQFVSVRTLESSAKKTRSGETIRFSGGSEDPALVDWIAGTYKPRHKPCAVCGAAQRTRKNVGCSPSEMELVR